MYFQLKQQLFELHRKCLLYIYLYDDECAANPCYKGTCTDEINGFTCSCDAGFMGTRCDTGMSHIVLDLKYAYSLTIYLVY